MVATDRRTSGSIVEDEAIELKSSSRIREALGDRGKISVTSYNRLVLLTGEVETPPKGHCRAGRRRRCQRAGGRQRAGLGMAQSFISRSRDCFLTSKVKASLIDAKDLFSNAIKVVTSNRTVYLMGRVTEREAHRAAEVARGVDGVRKVVRVFEVITEAELANLQPRSPAAGGLRAEVAASRTRFAARPSPSTTRADDLRPARRWASSSAPRKGHWRGARARRWIRLDVSARFPPRACSSA